MEQHNQIMFQTNQGVACEAVGMHVSSSCSCHVTMLSIKCRWRFAWLFLLSTLSGHWRNYIIL